MGYAEKKKVKRYKKLFEDDVMRNKRNLQHKTVHGMEIDG